MPDTSKASDERAGCRVAAQAQVQGDKPVNWIADGVIVALWLLLAVWAWLYLARWFG